MLYLWNLYIFYKIKNVLLFYFSYFASLTFLYVLLYNNYKN